MTSARRPTCHRALSALLWVWTRKKLVQKLESRWTPPPARKHSTSRSPPCRLPVPTPIPASRRTFSADRCLFRVRWPNPLRTRLRGHRSGPLRHPNPWRNLCPRCQTPKAEGAATLDTYVTPSPERLRPCDRYFTPPRRQDVLLPAPLRDIL